MLKYVFREIFFSLRNHLCVTFSIRLKKALQKQIAFFSLSFFDLLRITFNKRNAIVWKKNVSNISHFRRSLNLNDFIFDLHFSSHQHDQSFNIKQDLESILPNFDFFIFPTFAFKLGHFKVQTIFSHATNTQA